MPDAPRSEPPGLRLLDRVRRHIRVLHDSIRTEDAYMNWIRRFILFHGKRHPLEMGEVEFKAFLTHLAVEANVAASTENQTLSARRRGRSPLRRQAQPVRIQRRATPMMARTNIQAPRSPASP